MRLLAYIGFVGLATATAIHLLAWLGIVVNSVPLWLAMFAYFGVAAWMSRREGLSGKSVALPRWMNRLALPVFVYLAFLVVLTMGRSPTRGRDGGYELRYRDRPAQAVSEREYRDALARKERPFSAFAMLVFGTVAAIAWKSNSGPGQRFDEGPGTETKK
jgi:hypothetical protein